MVSIFSAHMTADEIVPFVVNLMHYEVIGELEGPIDAMLEEIAQVDERERAQIRANFKIDGRGNVVESDEDEDGNLK